MLQDLFYAPERLHPNRNSEQVTTAAADVFRLIADDMRKETSPPSPLSDYREGESKAEFVPLSTGGEGLGVRSDEVNAERIAHFLTKLVFCLFAEDVSLLPPGPKGD